ICVDALETLHDREFRSGLAEVIKHALLGAADLFELLETKPEAVLSRDTDALELCIARSLDIKGALVEEDFKEQNVRAHLNLGHTFGHALEAAAGFGEWSHGEAVAWGIDRALWAGVAAEITDKGYAERVSRLLKIYGYKIGSDAAGTPPESILAAMGHDKKNRSGQIRFVLQRDFGETLVSPLDAEILRTAIGLF
ncbi:MAG: 3-dehydroquinate synthase, partial [Spirochaetales bacterium]|nr:3-dehydroquinate synthase [Spirochaetales bacterium]